MKKLLFILLCSLCLTGCANYNADYAASSTELATELSKMQVKAFEEKYKGKVIRVSGMVDDKGQVRNGKKLYVILSGNDYFSCTRADIEFNGKNKEVVNKLKKGDVVEIVGNFVEVYNRHNNNNNPTAVIYLAGSTIIE